MIDANNRINAGGGHADRTHRPGGAGPADGPSDFERLLRQQRIQQQSRQVRQQPVPDAPPEVLFSKHAQQRLQKREIELAPDQSRRLEQAVDSAAGKGARQSLVFMDGIAFIVNVESRKVVTALNVQAGTTDANVFTNIDSAVLA